MKNCLRKLDRLEEYLCIFLFTSLIALCLLQILFRFVVNFSLSWTEELARYIFILLVYIAASLAIAKDAHVRVEIIDSFVQGKHKYYLDQLVSIVWAIFIFYIGYEGIAIATEALDIEQVTPAMELPAGIVYAMIPVCFTLMTFRLIQRIYRRYREFKSNQSIK